MDLARGMLMEQLGCTPAEAQRQLVRLAAESGVTPTEFAAQITHQDPPGEPPDPGMSQVSLARAAIETAASGNAVASALLGEALGSLGAVAVAIWLTEPDGGLELVGEAGFGSHEASRWRRLHPDMPSLPQQVARDGLETWWPAGPPPGDERPLPGRWRDGAWAGLPLHDAGAALGVMVVCWPEPAAEFPAPLRRQLASIADVAAQALGIRLSQGGAARRPRGRRGACTAGRPARRVRVRPRRARSRRPGDRLPHRPCQRRAPGSGRARRGGADRQAPA